MSGQPETPTPPNAPTGRELASPSGSASDELEDEYDDDGTDRRCHFCGGDGFVFGEDMGDPLWHEPDKPYRCTCCGGSGDAKDCTWW